VTEGWAYSGGPPALHAGGPVTLIEGTSFCISGRTGDIRPGAAQGLFFRDTRFLSQLELSLDGQVLEPLAAQTSTPYAGTFVLRRPPEPGTADSTLLVVRRRYVGNGLVEEVSLRNLGPDAVPVTLTVLVDSDFAGLFDVKEGRARPRAGVQRSAEGAVLRLAYEADRGDSRSVEVRGSAGATADASALTWQLVLESRVQTTVHLQVVPAVDGVSAPPRYVPGVPVEASLPATMLAAWRATAPVVSSPDWRLRSVLLASAEDLGVLRIFDQQHPDRVVVAAGAPWFMTLFGRDALLTSWMTLPLDTSLALGTLRMLADLQGEQVDPVSEEQPGRILHEVRSGLDAESALGGANVYYGSIDATPLFVMLLGELRRWGLGSDELDDLLPHADRALAWIEQHGDRDGDGFVEYQRPTDRGLLNQGWKDSFDGISFASGDLAGTPIALAEVQGYTYAAYLARAHFAREAGDDALAQRWAASAARLKERFNEAFWLPDRGWYAVALDGDKRPVDSLTSNIGHCLWTGIVDEDKAAAVAAHLLGPDMFTGYGVRTLAASMGAYNPMSYHNGSVWPHDNAIVAAGLMRYGFVDEAQRVALALLDAAAHFGGRLPELFCGFGREEFAEPVPYPTSCSPQAWAAAAPLFLLRTLLRFDPWVPFGKVWCDPAVPEALLPLRVDKVQVAGRSVSVSVTGAGWEMSGLGEGLELIRRGRPPLTAAQPESEPEPD
jgi:glycogen debranching enzyme